MHSKPAAAAAAPSGRYFRKPEDRKKSERKTRPVRVFNILEFDEKKMFLDSHGYSEKQGLAFAHDWYYLENPEDKQFSIQLYLNWIKIPWGIQLGWTDYDGVGNDRVAKKKEWQRGFQFEIRCPAGSLVFNREKDCFEGSKVEYINQVVTKFYKIQKRMDEVLLTAKNTKGKLILENASDWKKKLVRYNDKTGEPTVTIKLSGNPNINSQWWDCYTSMYKPDGSGDKYDMYDLWNKGCYDMVSDANIDIVGFVACGIPVARVQASAMTVYDLGSNIKPSALPQKPGMVPYVKEGPTEEEKAKQEAAQKEADETTAFLIQEAEEQAAKLLAGKGVKQEQEEERTPPKRSRLFVERDEENQEGGEDKEEGEETPAKTAG